MKGKNTSSENVQNEPTDEQLFALLEDLQRQGHNLDEISPDLSTLLKKVKKEKGQPAEDVPMVEITPEPSFVIKTQDTADNAKVFINVCASDKVPAPGNWKSGQVPDEVQKALENRAESGEEAESLRFPLSCGQLKADVDKKGDRCFSCDCILNADVLKQAAVFRPLKSFLIELSIGWVSHKTGKTLDPKYKLPKMKYKGDEIEKQNIRVERKPLVCEVMDLEEEPTFPLVTKKHPNPIVPPPGATSILLPSSTASTSLPSSSHTSSAQSPSAHPAVSSHPTQQQKPAGGGLITALTHTVEYLHRPVDEVLVTINIPQSSTSTALKSGSESEVVVEVSGKSVLVTIPGFKQLNVQLLFSVMAVDKNKESRSRAELDLPNSKLLIHLKYMPLKQYMEAMRCEKPLSFGHLGVNTSGLLELES
ncbi:hypothetical protein CEUSTIGMA_g2498.t1 [Chlamydomonas eustigma]|uniref:PIH1 N-terminal domain-containing protein n=1 Tax=Chlamydomonas eustigma TaxID=1157962 RepID=A0A250WW35_9CHLO|nr:hypothetical protein CEUSTIGMA_g2498.t1 [Chlamydomonas eustigma]|eukprot:GAX75054.1 hypothetical protein CEUSTIGMA_g2498.t1 [Chlamydomonas eustigma]